MKRRKRTLGEKIWFATGTLALAMAIIFPAVGMNKSANNNSQMASIIEEKEEVPLAEEIPEESTTEEE